MGFAMSPINVSRDITIVSNEYNLGLKQSKRSILCVDFIDLDVN